MEQFSRYGPITEARSSISASTTEYPRPTASRAMPHPLMPPPMIKISLIFGLSYVPKIAQTPNGPVVDDIFNQVSKENLRFYSFISFGSNFTQVIWKFRGI